MPKFVEIHDDYGIIKELAVFPNRTFGIKKPSKHGNYYVMVSEKKFLSIIRTAMENGLTVYDYTDFD